MWTTQASLLGHILLYTLLMACTSGAQTTKPDDTPALKALAEQAARELRDAEGALESAISNSTEAVKQTPEYKAQFARVAAAEKVYEQARADGSPQARLDASSKLNREKDALKSLAAKAMQNDPVIAAARQLRDEKKDAATRARAAAESASKASMLAAETERLQQIIRSSRQGRRVSPSDVKDFKKVGDETSFAKVKADAHAFKGRAITVAGAAAIDDYFNYRFDGAAETHHSIRFHELTENMDVVARTHTYVAKGQAAALIDELTAAGEQARGRVVRLRVILSERCFSYGQWQEQTELLDWQFYDAQTNSWGPWASEVAAAEKRLAELR